MHLLYDLLFHRFGHTTKKRGVHGRVYIDLNIVRSQCLFLGCKNQCFSFNFQVTFRSPLPGQLSREFPVEIDHAFFFTVHLFKAALLKVTDDILKTLDSHK